MSYAVVFCQKPRILGFLWRILRAFLGGLGKMSNNLTD